MMENGIPEEIQILNNDFAANMKKRSSSASSLSPRRRIDMDDLERATEEQRGKFALVDLEKATEEQRGKFGLVDLERASEEQRRKFGLVDLEVVLDRVTPDVLKFLKRTEGHQQTVAFSHSIAKIGKPHVSHARRKRNAFNRQSIASHIGKEKVKPSQVEQAPKRQMIVTKYGRVTNAPPQRTLSSPERQPKPAVSLSPGKVIGVPTTSLPLLNAHSPKKDLTPMLQALGLQRVAQVPLTILTNPRKHLGRAAASAMNVRMRTMPPTTPSAVTNNTARKAASGTSPTTCYRCLKVFQNRHQFQNHRKVHSDHLCLDCGWRFDSYAALKRHVLEKISNGTMSIGEVPVGPGSKVVLVQKRHNGKANMPPRRFSESTITRQQTTITPWDSTQQRRLNRASISGVIPSSTADAEVIILDSSSNGFDDVYPPNFLQSSMEVDLLENYDEPAANPYESTENLTSEVTITRHTSAPQTGLIESGTSYFGKIQTVKGYKVPPITTGPAPPTVAVMALPNRRLAGLESTPRASESLFRKSSSPLGAPHAAPELTFASFTKSQTISINGYASYQELLEPLAKVKQFGVDNKDGAIIYTIHELEKHILTAMLSQAGGNSGNNA